MMRFPALILVPVLALGLTAARAAGLPDTGQDKCDDGSNFLMPCTNATTGDFATYPRQDGRFGRDAKARAGTLTKTGGGTAGFDYSKVLNDGTVVPGPGLDVPLGTGSTDWACTRDNITGLTWEVKVDDATHLRHRNWTYTWYNSNGSTNAGNAGTPDTDAGVGSDNCLNPSRCDTEWFVADVNATKLCGYADWRMPTQRELFTLVHFGAQAPSIDAFYFPNTQAAGFWSSSSFATVPANAWVVDFVISGLGFNQYDSAKSGSYYVRLVRGVTF